MKLWVMTQGNRIKTWLSAKEGNVFIENGIWGIIQMNGCHGHHGVRTDQAFKTGGEEIVRTMEDAPLIESVFELHWKLLQDIGTTALQVPVGGLVLQSDPNYRLAFARLSDKLSIEYPKYIPLPQANLPDAMVPHMVQHRFQADVASNTPIVQVGPGVLTVNQASGYSWKEFKSRIQSVLSMFYNSYPTPEDLVLENVSLKYINGFSFDYEVLDPVQFVRENLSLGISLPSGALGESINKNAVHMNFQVSFNTYLPPGTFTSSWATGELEHRKTLFWQIWLTSLNPASDFYLASDDWLNAVHEVIERWFFSSLSGKLRKELLHE